MKTLFKLFLLFSIAMLTSVTMAMANDTDVGVKIISPSVTSIQFPSYDVAVDVISLDIPPTNINSGINYIIIQDLSITGCHYDSEKPTKAWCNFNSFIYSNYNESIYIQRKFLLPHLQKGKNNYHDSLSFIDRHRRLC